MGKVLDYTDRQKKILNGFIPIDKVKDASLKKLLNKAIQMHDIEAAKTVGHWLSVREEQRLPEYSEYTDKQQAVLAGQVSLDKVSGVMAKCLLDRAMQLNDEKVIAFAKELVSKSYERRIENNRERARNRRQIVKNDIFEWKQPKASDYSEHHRKIIRGEIPLEKVATKELISIHMIAKSKGDIELSERFLSLIIDRRQGSIERANERLTAFKKRNREHVVNSDVSCNKLTKYEKDILHFEVDMDEVSERVLEHIISVCEKISDEQGAHLARLLLQYKRHPESVFPTQDRNEAIDMIEAMIGKPIRRPETWFI